MTVSYYFARRGRMTRFFRNISFVMLIATVLSFFIVMPVAAQSQSSAKYKVYLILSYSGNIWQSAAANGVEALANTPPYDDLVDLTKIISGTEPQSQISDIQSAILAGADAVLFYAISPNALNRVIQYGCGQGVLMVAYDSPVTAPCAYNVTTLTAGYGANSAQWLVNALGGEGTVVINHGVAGTALTQLWTKQQKAVYSQYPGIDVVSTFYGNWNDALSKNLMSKVLSAHPDVQAVWTTDGSYGTLQAILEQRSSGPINLAIVGQSNNAFRLALNDPALRARGLRGVSSSQPPADGPYAFKVLMEMLLDKIEPKSHQIEYPIAWVSGANVKICKGEKFVDGCNAFPKGVVPPLFLDTALDSTYLPELSLQSVKTGKPMPGATIQPLPPLEYGYDLPGVNCENCEPPEGWLKPNKVTPIAVPDKNTVVTKIWDKP